MAQRLWVPPGLAPGLAEDKCEAAALGAELLQKQDRAGLAGHGGDIRHGVPVDSSLFSLQLSLPLYLKFSYVCVLKCISCNTVEDPTSSSNTISSPFTS